MFVSTVTDQSRKFVFGCVETYRYGFNGKENDNEVKGVQGSQQDYGMRIYDPRLGKFLSVDPLAKSFPFYTPYQFAGNKPIIAVDLDGEEEKIVIHYLDQHSDGTLFVVETSVSIDQKKQFVGPSGTTYATTHVYYSYNNQLVYGGVLLEKITPDGMKPSASYDYTQEENSEKFSDDLDYMGLSYSKFKELQARDENAPDNAITMQDLEVLEVTPAGRFAPKGNNSKLGARSPEAQAEYEKNIKKGIPPNQLGPSGKPKVHTVETSSKKEAKDAARNSQKSNTAPVKHTNDKGQKSHYHSTRNNEKLGKKDNVHYNYPSKTNAK